VRNALQRRNNDVRVTTEVRWRRRCGGGGAMPFRSERLRSLP